ncbi:MAG: hypothetical protein QNJ75_00740 [Acidimicrobiia bacterium]|nr:hypothetical protein [Acidimicrobiia bacterium]
MRLGIDLDGVVANFVRGWMLRYNMDFGTNLTEEQVDRWDAARDLTHFTDLVDFWQWAGASGHGPTVFRSLEPYPDSLEALNHLAACHDIVILSMKPDWAAADTYAWIAEHRIPTREVHLLRDKWLVPCDVYLDDSPIALPGLLNKQPQAIVCRYVRPWNEPLEGAVDIHNWQEFASLVDRIKDDRDCQKRE